MTEEQARRVAEARASLEMLRQGAGKDRFAPARVTNAPGASTVGTPPPEAPLTYGRRQVSLEQGGLPVNLVEDQWVYGGFWAQVNSSNVAAIAYDIEWDEMLVEFRSGAVYAYLGVPEQAARDFYRASSPGRFVWQRLRDKYTHIRRR